MKHNNSKSFYLKLFYAIGVIIILIIVFNFLKTQNTSIQDKDNKSKALSTQSKNSKSNNTKLTIQNSTFKGVSKDLEPYEITADTASKISENQFKLDKVGANYIVSDGVLLVNAKSGLLDDVNHWMDLHNNVEILFNKMIVNSNNIHINFITKEILSKTQVEMIYKNSEVKADSFTSKENNNIINFQGNVQTKIKLKDF